MKVLISTQYLENYGAHDWDGVGECPQYWKAKGGSEYFLPVEGFNPDHEFADKRLEMIVDSACVREQVEWSNSTSRSYIIGYELVQDDYMTEFERSQLDYEGVIRFPAKVLKEAVV
jgi:hypothetical protein